jgi:hypothetical protein
MAGLRKLFAKDSKMIRTAFLKLSTLPDDKFLQETTMKSPKLSGNPASESIDTNKSKKQHAERRKRLKTLTPGLPWEQ